MNEQRSSKVDEEFSFMLQCSAHIETSGKVIKLMVESRETSQVSIKIISDAMREESHA